LKKLLAEAMLNNAILKGVRQKTGDARREANCAHVVISHERAAGVRPNARWRSVVPPLPVMPAVSVGFIARTD
jgi:hypothetical protein